MKTNHGFLKLEEGEDTKRNYIFSSIGFAFWIVVVKLFWPDVIPFEVFSFWEIKEGFWTPILISWPLFAYGALLNIIFAHHKYNELSHIFNDPVEGLKQGLRGSFFAGIAEEIAFRWIIFLGAIITVKVANFCFFGFLGFGITEWIHLAIWGPLADWTTFKYLHEFIFSEKGWAVGAALLYSNAFFREGHGYQGLYGVINSWFLGMFFFYIAFTYGLLGAIMVHMIYDMAIDFTVFFYASFRDWRERTKRTNTLLYPD